jgi:predicted permease
MKSSRMIDVAILAIGLGSIVIIWALWWVVVFFRFHW